jgi:hypothetical protein
MINEKDQWLGIVRPLLGGIRTNAFWIKYHAKEVADKVRMLPYKPDFETEALAEIDEAIKAIAEVRERLQEARLAYSSKPVG